MKPCFSAASWLLAVEWVEANRGQAKFLFSSARKTFSYDDVVDGGAFFSLSFFFFLFLYICLLLLLAPNINIVQESIHRRME